MTSEYAGGNDPWKGLDAFTSHGNGMPLNWHNQGADAGLYSNDQIHAVRVLAMEPTTDRKGANAGRRFHSHANERLRILGEIPLRSFVDGKQPIDPDGNPDTSFLAKIPADTAFTFQTLDEKGMVLNMAQTWHQLRPGEIRHDCGGCHAHSQKPTEFAQTRAAKPDYKVWDLVNTTPLVVDKKLDESNRQWDVKKQTGLRKGKAGIANVEYFRDIQPILKRSCVACHTAKNGKEPAAKLNLDADDELVQYGRFGKFPGTYYRLALDEAAKFGHKPPTYSSWGYPNASRYIRKFQSRRSMLVWKLYDERLDGFHNDDHPSPPKPGAKTLVQKGKAVDLKRNRARYDLDHRGPQMPPPNAVQSGIAAPLSDEDRRTIVRWIDLGCPIDLDYNPSKPEERGFGWMLDDNRPILSMTEPQPGENQMLTRILIGSHDYMTGLDTGSLRIVADFEIDGAAAGKNIADRFRKTTQGVWEYRLKKPITQLTAGKLTLSIQDREGNTTRIQRTLSVR